jgi:hypothetical protein
MMAMPVKVKHIQKELSMLAKENKEKGEELKLNQNK